MKQVIPRFIAIMLLVVPGIGATYGFLLMKDAVFHYFASFGAEDAADVTRSFEWGLFLLGLLLFAVGIGFLGGWTFFRDRKRNYLAPRFRGKRPRPPRPVRPGAGAAGTARTASAAEASGTAEPSKMAETAEAVGTVGIAGPAETTGSAGSPRTAGSTEATGSAGAPARTSTEMAAETETKN